MPEVLPAWTGATIHLHRQCRFFDDAPGGPRQTEAWCLIGWHATGQPITGAEVRLEGEAFLTRLEVGDLFGALACLQRALPGARISVAGPGVASGHPEPFFQATRSRHRQLGSESWRWEQVGTDFFPVAIQ